jgi:methenyltetrahydromethanopterin cyclohydrolase
LSLVKEAIRRESELRIHVTESPQGVTIVDFGIDVQGGYLAGKYLTEICMGGLGSTLISDGNYGTLNLPSISVYTDQPAIALLGSQFAGWRIKTDDYFAMCSGPGRALAHKPRNIYNSIAYEDGSDVSILVLESDSHPTPEALNLMAKECNVNADRLYVLVAPTSSLSGSTQISGRVLETGLHRLTNIGMDPRKVVSGLGVAPIAPVHPQRDAAMGRTNDMILYGGATFFTVDVEDDAALKKHVEQASSTTSRDYGRKFVDIFRSVNEDFYKIDPAIFAPAVVMVSNIRTGSTFSSGRINNDVLRLSIS